MDGRVALERVSKWYGPRRRVALHEVDLTFEPGAATAVAGPNGSGKTTLLRVLAGAAVPSRGRVRHRPRSIGYAPERFPAGLRFTPAEYLGHMARLHRLPQRAVAARIDELAARLRFQPVLGERMAALSKGTVQRVVLAQALLGRPELLVLDEPWTGLDAVTQRRLADLLAELRSDGVCVVLSDHHELAVDAVADRICRLDSGRLVADTTVTAGSRPAWPAEPPVLVELTGDDPTAPQALQDLDGVLTVDEDGSLLRVRVAAGASDALLARALDLGLSVRRVEPLQDAAEESPAGLAGEAP